MKALFLLFCLISLNYASSQTEKSGGTYYRKFCIQSRDSIQSGNLNNPSFIYFCTSHTLDNNCPTDTMEFEIGSEDEFVFSASIADSYNFTADTFSFLPQIIYGNPTSVTETHSTSSNSPIINFFELNMSFSDSALFTLRPGGMQQNRLIFRFTKAKPAPVEETVPLSVVGTTSVSPNPFSDEIAVNISTGQMVTVMSADGKIARSIYVSPGEKINLFDLEKGIYFLSSDEISAVKILKH